MFRDVFIEVWKEPEKRTAKTVTNHIFIGNITIKRNDIIIKKQENKIITICERKITKIVVTKLMLRSDQ